MSPRHVRRLALFTAASLAVAALVALLWFVGSGRGDDETRESGEIAVLLPLTGPGAIDWATSVDWAIETINDAGGVNGIPLRATLIDTGQEDLTEAARRVARDPSVLAVIGPDSSQAVFTVAPLFVSAQKVMISPSATSADLFRALSPHDFFWRTVGSDISQLRALLDLAARDGARRVALVTGSGLYGQTFFDWFGFLAAESGLEATAVVRYDQSSEACGRAMSEALSTRADVLIAVPEDLASRGGTSAEATSRCMADAWRSSGGGVRLLFPDSAVTPALIDDLGVAAEGLEGTSPALDPAFEAAFKQRFGREAPPYAANVFDAVLLIAYGLERSGGEGGAALARSMQELTGFRSGTTEPWAIDAVKPTLEAIASGDLVDIRGASGPLDFDPESFTDPIDNVYRHWRVEGGVFTTVDTLDGTSGRTEAEPHPARIQDIPGQEAVPVPDRTGLWAVLIAASAGWDNYRHQADVLAFYQSLRKQGVPDERIILVMDGDLPFNSRNPEPGVVRNEPGGPNLFEHVTVDYDIAGMTTERVMAILSGSVTPSTPVVLGATQTDNVFVFIAGHGEKDGVYLGAGQPVLGAYEAARTLGPEAMRSALSAVPYRRLLVAIEACKSGAFGAAFDLPRGLLLTAASPTENSRGGTYDLDKRIWITDQFSEALWRAAAVAPATSLSEVYRRLYSTVTGSHVGAYGTAFGDARAITIGEFFSP
jgi:ABC-type branched-subunit amino acid transport system substrate-binding protein/glycosylphosphatidylinositol transamidase (GPIT) subunit GPI8